MQRQTIAAHLETALRNSLDSPGLRLMGLHGERPAADRQREPWIDVKYGPANADDWFGVVPATAWFARGPGKDVETLELIVKVNPRLSLARNLIPWIIKTRSIRLDRPYWEFRNAREVDDTTDREFNIYEEAANGSTALSDVLPRYYGSGSDAFSGERVLFLERLSDVSRLDATGTKAAWPCDAITDALRAMATWQVQFWKKDHASLPWAGPRMTADDMLADESLWRGLVDDAHQRFPDVVTDATKQRRHQLIDTIDQWYTIKDKLPSTLAHNDFNQRNVGFRPSVVVLDWELVQNNTAHRDLVELLTFVLPASFGRAEIDQLVEDHRKTLVALGVVGGVERDCWYEAFRSELKLEAINRVGMQCIFNAAFPLAYFARINSNIDHLLNLYA